MMSADSPVVEEVRRARMELSARFDHDLHKLFEYIKEVEAKHKDRLVNQRTIVRSPERPLKAGRGSVRGEDSPVVEEVRRARMKLSARFDHDLDKLFAHIMKVQTKRKERQANQPTVIRAPEKKARKSARRKAS